MVAIEPGLWHPVGATLALANRLGVAPAIHGTPDDIPLSPKQLTDEAVAESSRMLWCNASRSPTLMFASQAALS